jgi:hypothetical protein
MNRLLFLAYISSLISIVKLCPDGWYSLPVDNNRCYLVVENRTDWFTAESYCRVHAASGAHLASICSQFENANIDCKFISKISFFSNISKISKIFFSNSRECANDSTRRSHLDWTKKFCQARYFYVD